MICIKAWRMIEVHGIWAMSLPRRPSCHQHPVEPSVGHIHLRHLQEILSSSRMVGFQARVPPLVFVHLSILKALGNLWEGFLQIQLQLILDSSSATGRRKFASWVLPPSALGTSHRLRFMASLERHIHGRPRCGAGSTVPSVAQHCRMNWRWS